MSIQIIANIAGVSQSAEVTPAGEGAQNKTVSLPAGNAGVLTRSDANTGVATLSTGHGLLTNDVCDVFWSGGIRYGMTATVDVNAVTLDGGAGDDLPATAATAVVVTKQVSVDCRFSTTLLTAILASCSSASQQRCHLDFQITGGTSKLAYELVAGGALLYAAAMGGTNPFASGDILTLKASNGGVVAATLNVGFVENSVA